VARDLLGHLPVALITLVLIAKAKPAQNPQHTEIDYRGAVLITAAMALVVLGLQQAGTSGWTSAGMACGRVEALEPAPSAA
jgi:hypothetical protein